METIITPTQNAQVADFTASGSFTLLADGLTGFEKIYLERKGPSGEYHPVGAGSGWVELSASQNTVPIDAVGEIEWRVVKAVTKKDVSVSVCK